MIGLSCAIPQAIIKYKTQTGSGVCEGEAVSLRKTRIFSFLPVVVVCIAVLLCSGCIKGPDFPYVLSPRVIVQTPSNPASANIAITFQLIDREKEPGNITLEYSTNGGGTFKEATLVDLSESQNLQSDWYPGITHTVQWNSVTDMVGISGNASVIVKVTPSDATNPSGGTSDVSRTFTVNNIEFNQPPGVSITTPTGIQLGNIPINYSLSDVESDTCVVAVEYSVDGGDWQIATMGWAGDGLTGLSSSPSGTTHMFLWNSRADNIALAGQEDNIKVRITPSDFHTGNPAETASFSVDNSIENNPPTVTITDGPEEGSTVYTRYVTFTWSGSDTDGTVIGYYYSFDRDPPNIWTTATSVTSGVLSLGQHTFRVFAVDDRYDFSAVQSRTFTVAPGVIQANFSASPTSGAAPLTVNFTDLSTASSGITSWSWNFGDGTTSTAQNPVHIYTSVRSYTVSLTVTGPDGSDTETKTNYITVTPPGPTIYVDGTNGSDTNDGLSWATAVKTIQKGLDLAAATASTVWVANETYTGAGNKDLDFRGKAAHLKSVGGAANCIIDCENSGRGFYFGSGEDANSVVEGFTIRNGDADYGGAVYCKDSSPTITNCTFSGNSADSGGAVYCYYSSSPTFTNCTISDNWTGGFGGGICCTYNSSPTMSSCTIMSNTASYGGAVECYENSMPVLNNTILWGNTGSLGNQIYTNGVMCAVTLNFCGYANGANDIAGSGTLTPNNCINLDPLFVDAANGDYRLQATSPCIDAGNNSYIPAGVTTDLDGNPRIVDGNNDGTATVDLGAYEYCNTLFVDGTNGSDTNNGLSWATAVKTIQKGLDLASATGWTVQVANGTYTGTGNKDLDFAGKAIHLQSLGGAENCIIDCENSGRGFLFHSGETSASMVRGFTIRNGNVSGRGGGIYCGSSSPTITGCVIANNTGGDYVYGGGGIYCYSCNSIISNCTIESNNATADGGGILCDNGSSLTIINSVIRGNDAYGGGGITCGESNPTITNCVIANNTARAAYFGGGGIHCYESSPVLTNCTIAGNSASYGGGLTSAASSNPSLNNVICWSNNASSGGKQIYVFHSNASVTLNHSDYSNGTDDVAGSGPVTANNCINLDPLFVDAANGNYRLQSMSPCIDAGDNSLVPADVATDLDGNPRIADGNNDGIETVDIGAYESLAPGPAYCWTKRMGGSDYEYAYAVCTDGSGNVYVAGEFEGTVNFAQDWGGSETKSSAAGDDIFVTKIDASGNYCWTHTMCGSADNDWAHAICTDGSGNIYVAGGFRGTVNFAEDWGSSDTKVSAEDYDIFITKIDASGNYVWTRRIGGSDYDCVKATCTDGSGNVYLAGYFQGTVNFAQDWGSSDTKVSAGYKDIFITKIDASGNYCWTRRIGGSSDDSAYAVCADGSGNVYVAGEFRVTVNFAQDWGGADIKSAAGSSDIFITRIHASGNYVWTHRIGASYAYAVCTDEIGNVYMAGEFHGTVNLAEDWGGIDTKVASGGSEVFITRIDERGNYCWARKMDARTDWGHDAGAICADGRGNIYLAGYFWDTVNFAADWSETDTKVSAGKNDVFITKIAP
jgi:PKD repeat protein